MIDIDIDLDLRVVVVGVLVAATTAAAPVALGGGIAAGGGLAALLAARSVARSNEGSVTTAIIAGGLLVLATLSRGHVEAMFVCAGVFAGAEIAALGRRLAIDPEAPAGPEVVITLATIGLGVSAGAVIALVSLWRADPPLANVALAVLALLGAAAFTLRHLRQPAD